ncbi:cytochrome P450 [Peniophora sp. CONT]|nr:cytochrome P450 [Peniophora sp. CONT]
MSSATSWCLFGLPLVVLAACLLSRKRSKQYPPGPIGLPFLGHVLGMPRREDWEEWASRYGDIVHISTFGKHIIMINSAQAAIDLLEKRSAIYSDRPHFPLIDLAGQGFNFGFMPYGKAWSSRRRTFAAYFGRSFPDIYPSHHSAVMHLLHNLRANPRDFMEHVRLHAAQVILEVTYGLSVQSCEDRLVRNAEAVLSDVAMAVRPETWVLNPVMILHFLPGWLGGNFLARCVQQWQTNARELWERPYKLATENDSRIYCFVQNLLDSRPPQVSVESHTKLVMDSSAVAYGGGAETTTSAGNTFFLAMALYPDVQRLAYSEIVKVIGTGRLPDFSDRSNLPYISAVAREIFRWNPPGPLGVPHLLTEEDFYCGYCLPKGSIVVSNIWHMTHDPTIYARPHDFEPERHLEGGKLVSEDSVRVSFGFGRRVCPGKAFAEDSLWLLVAQVLAVFEISSIDSDVPRASFSSSTFSQPLPFRCDIKLRSEDSQALLGVAD